MRQFTLKIHPLDWFRYLRIAIQGFALKIHNFFGKKLNKTFKFIVQAAKLKRPSITLEVTKRRRYKKTPPLI